MRTKVPLSLNVPRFFRVFSKKRTKGGLFTENITIKLQPGEGKPLYEQLYRFLQEEMTAGRLRPGEKLPSKRALCTGLGVSHSTVETAYGMLSAEGWIVSRPKRGYFVADELDPAPRLAERPAPSPEIAPPAPAPRYDFSTGAVDTSIFPYASWARLSREVISAQPELLQRGEVQGDRNFRETLADFLREYRGVRCTPEQIVVGAGLEYLLGLVIQLFPGDMAFAIEDPGYGALRRVLQNHERTICPIPLDDHGLRADALRESPARVAYVTPSHQYPMGVTMPASRRSKLLRWAAEAPGRYLIEDDYDSDFRSLSRPIPAMQGMDGERVIYIGTFSRSIAPSIRVAYLVLPESLLPVYRERFGLSASTVSRFEQQTLNAFLRRGLYSRHLRRSASLYRKKEERLLAALARELPEAVVSGAGAGLHFLLTLPGREEGALLEQAARAGIPLRGLSGSCLRVEPPGSTLILGFAGLGLADIDDAAAALARAFGGEKRE